MDISKFTARFGEDQQKALQGIDVPIGEGFVIKVARSNNDRASAAYRELMSAPNIELWRRAGLLDRPNDEVVKRLREINIEIYSKHILIGWTGLTENGIDVPYSPAKARELLAIPDFNDLVRRVAETSENYRRDAVEGAAEILGKPSNGN